MTEQEKNLIMLREISVDVREKLEKIDEKLMQLDTLVHMALRKARIPFQLSEAFKDRHKEIDQ